MFAYHDSVLELRDVNPAAASGSAGGGAELAACGAEGLPGSVQELSGKGALAHAGAVSLIQPWREDKKESTCVSIQRTKMRR